MRSLSISAPAFICMTISALAIIDSAVKKTPEIEFVSVMDITEVKQDCELCVLDYCLKDEFRNLPRPPWLNSWDDLMSNSLCSSRYDVKVDPKAITETKARMLLFSLASGYAVDHWHTASIHKRFAGSQLEEMMNILWVTGDIPASLMNCSPKDIKVQAKFVGLDKRHIYKVEGPHNWVYAEDNRARVSALAQLERDLNRAGDRVVNFVKSHVCHLHGDWRGCFSWSGGETFLRSDVGARVISSGISGYNDDGWVSAKANGVLRNRLWNGVSYIERSHNACLSNRPNGCT